MASKFTKWIYSQLKERNWQPADLSKESGIDSGSLSRILNGQRKISLDNCLKIARALNLPPEMVFRKAAMLPDDFENNNLTAKKLLEIVKKLSPEERGEILDYAIFRYNRLKKTDSKASLTESV